MALILAAPDDQGMRIVATVVFVIAALTDLADGYLARRWQLTSTLGAFLDTVADKILVAGALLALVEIGTVSTWVAFIIIGREIAIMGLRSVAALDQGTVPPSMWGVEGSAAVHGDLLCHPPPRCRYRTLENRPVVNGRCRRLNGHLSGRLLLEVPIGVHNKSIPRPT